mgnify:CR=1 FL=1
MKTFSSICFLLFLSACSPTITGAHITRAVNACEDKNGIAALYAPTIFAVVDLQKIYSVECVNRQVVNIGDTK